VTLGDASVGGQYLLTGGRTFVENNFGTTALNITDAGDTTARNVSHTIVDKDGKITGLANNATIRYRLSSTSSVNLIGGDGADTFAIEQTVVPFTLNTGDGDDVVNVGTTGLGANVALVDPVARIASMSIGDASSASLAGPAGQVLYTSSLQLAATATLDVADKFAVVDYTKTSQLQAVQDWINSGRNGGDWSGFGIISSTARDANPHNSTLGALEASSFKSIYGTDALFAGQSIDDSAALIRHTYYGDTDFNGVVDFDDYSRTDSGFNRGESGWQNGDFDGNGVVDFDDYSLIDLAFNTQSGALRPARTPAPKPRGARLL
jgi:hypothetical protein